MSTTAFFKYVTPNHFSPSDYVPAAGFDAEREFDLIAPIAIYFDCDCSAERRKRAHAALKALKAGQYPLFQDASVKDILDQRITPDGVADRYNGLVMVIADNTIPGIESYIDSYGAFSLVVGDDRNVAMGDTSGYFRFFTGTQALKERLAMALETAGEYA